MMDSKSDWVNQQLSKMMKIEVRNSILRHTTKSLVFEMPGCNCWLDIGDLKYFSLKMRVMASFLHQILAQLWVQIRH